MVSVGWLCLHYNGYVQVHGKDIQFIKLYLKHMHATVDLCSLCFKLTGIALVWVQDQVDFCADINYLLSVHSTSTIT